MRLALTLNYSGARMSIDMDKVLELERLGYDSVWSAESYGSDAVTPVAWIAARTTRIHVGTGIMQMGGRTPAATAMTAMTLDALSGGRFRLGLGVSGPQVVEGWHGQPFGRPLQRTREYVEIVRRILRREKPLEFRGEYYQVPYTGPDATGLGKPLKSILHGRGDIPIYLAAVGPKNIALAAEIADGWIPTFFSAARMAMFREWLDAGFRARGGAPAQFDLMPMVAVVVGDDVAACRAPVKAKLALYVGGMGARGRNFYHDIACRYGYVEAARTIQDLYLAGRKAEAEASVPDALVDEVALCGPRERIRELLSVWRGSGVTTLMVAGDRVAVRTMAELVL
ncbi:MAG: LLM class F420-dependent oxidoreductase [Candidatus Rokubacteria bacterium RBG_16_73_20]|nr:MAG: LLM class F420-dependent oxidoreductase [Candidatus Rokubacteria bacterium GWA2_73_35]OGK93860.1 MAG: LLM class F420-dependent oxidoreductase [Candidatus Rokubacteria bacterium RBG_16_73_20]HBH01865.1 LLM class F420-dependent oxidoreductase [Candidatus Rokubacteria bacterium]